MRIVLKAPQKPMFYLFSKATIKTLTHKNVGCKLNPPKVANYLLKCSQKHQKGITS